MLPIAPLMIEHRLIEKMIAVIQKEIERSEQQNRINPEFIDLAVDFIECTPTGATTERRKISSSGT